MMAILEINGNIALYSGSEKISTVHIPNHTISRPLSEKMSAPENTIGAAAATRNSLGNQKTKSPFLPFPRRSSLLPTALQKSSFNDNTFDDELHMLSPVPTLQSSANRKYVDIYPSIDIYSEEINS